MLGEREKALAAFEECHRTATPEDRNNCLGLLEELVGADEDLQELGRSRLAEAARDRHASPLRTKDRQPVTACFDRKA